MSDPDKDKVRKFVKYLKSSNIQPKQLEPWEQQALSGYLKKPNGARGIGAEYHQAGDQAVSRQA